MACGLAVVAVLSVARVSLAGGVKNPIKKPGYDPTAEVVELFDGMESKQLAVRIICKSEFEANVFIENKTSKPLTVKLPRAAVGVQVLKQGFGPGLGNLAGPSGTGSLNANQQQGNGQAQNTGGTLGQNMGQQNFAGLPGAGMPGGVFSVPSEKTVQVQFNSVCLNHGKPTPRPAMEYKLVPVGTYTDDPVLQELLANVGTGTVDRATAQAAAWHLTDKLSWEQLSAQALEYIGGRRDALFSRKQIDNAMALVKQAELKSQERAKIAAAKSTKKL